MEILVLQNGWSGFGVSGGDQHVLDLCTRLKNHNDVTVMAPKPGISYISNRTDLGGVVTWELHDSFKATTLEGLFLLLIVYIERALRASVCVLPKRDFKLIIASSHFIYDVLPAAVYKILRGEKTIVYVYHLIGSQKRKMNLRNFLAVAFENISLFFIKKCFDVVVTDNHETYKDLLSKGVKKENMVMSILGVKKPDSKILGVEKKYDLVYLGRISRLKGAFDLVEILKILKTSKHNISINVIGKGEDEVAVKARVTELGLSENFHFSGFLSGETKIEEMAKGKIFLFPSYEEGWGIALAEAMSLSMPSVVYQLPAYLDVFSRGPCYVDVGNFSEMSSQVIKLLNDERYFHEKSQNALDCVKGYYLETAQFREFEKISVKI